MRIPIVFSTDHNYVMPTAVTIASLLMSSRDSSYDIYILASPDVNDTDREKIAKQINSIDPDSCVEFISLGEQFNGGFEIRGISTACYYRLLIPWLIPQHDKIIYSDVDIIFTDDLKELYLCDPGNNLVAGVNTPGFTSKKKAAKYISRLNLNPAEYINSGLLLINSKIQREENLRERYIQLSKRKFRFQDQDIINIVCAGRIKHLPSRFNEIPNRIVPKSHSAGNQTGLLHSVVIHYAGPKPWNAFTPGWMEWWNVWNKTIFSDYEYYREACRRSADRKLLVKSWIKILFEKYFR